VKERDIRPPDLFNQFLELSRGDIDTFFADKISFASICCPGCGSQDSQKGLVKHGFEYLVCTKCRSLYCSPRPRRTQLEAFYQHSKAVEFWASHFYAETADARRRIMFRPRAQLASHIARDRKDGPASPIIVDIGSGYGMLLEEARDLGTFGAIVGVEPSQKLASLCRERGFTVINKYAEELELEDIQADVATCFEVLEHVHDPHLFLLGIRSGLRANGRLLLTTLTASGFDIQVLWENSKSVSPPHHLNFLSVEGMGLLFERSGYRVLTVETPGQLDVDIVANFYRENQEIKRSRFVEELIVYSDEKKRAAFQDFLASNCLSSHIRVIGERVN
jgi:2-polyprenyl-3-methyl-5-hydroxy-6-metoxy-1,4-benzoquinol methylase